MDFLKLLSLAIDNSAIEKPEECPFPDEFMLECMIQKSLNSDLEFSETLPQLNKNTQTKCEKEATAFYNQGKEILKKKNPREALKTFTDALRSSPGSANKILSSCYIARSVCLKKLKYYTESLEDIKRALKFQLEKEVEEKLLKRKKIIETLLSTQELKNLKLTEDSDEKEELSYGENQEILGVSSALSLEYNEQLGRHYIANQDIKIGDFLMIQKPYVLSSWLNDSMIVDPETFQMVPDKKWICDNCRQVSINPVPCESCMTPVYCSEDCRSEGFKKFHKTECKVCQKFPPNQEILPLRALIIATNHGEKIEEIFNLMEKVDNCKDRRQCGFDEKGQLNGFNPAVLFSLQTHSDKQKLTENVTTSAIIVDLLRKRTNFFKDRNDAKIVMKAAKLLVRLSYICKMNLHGIRGTGMSDKIGLSMFPVLNYLNNSCANNAFCYDKKGKKILRACKDIQKGEQVCISYLTTKAKDRTFEWRQNFFKTIKFFTCLCEACKNNYNFKLELKGRLKVPAKLKKTLLSEPNNTSSLWNLLRLVYKKYQGPSLESKEIEIALANSLMGSKNETFPSTLLKLKLV